MSFRFADTDCVLSNKKKKKKSEREVEASSPTTESTALLSVSSSSSSSSTGSPSSPRPLDTIASRTTMMPSPSNGFLLPSSGGEGAVALAEAAALKSSTTSSSCSPIRSSAPTRTRTPTRRNKRRRRFCLGLVRSLLLDLPLMLLFGLLLTMLLLRFWYSAYYQTLFDRARRTNNDLQHEYTYYHRECTRYDMTTPQLLLDLVVLPAPRKAADTTATTAADAMNETKTYVVDVNGNGMDDTSTCASSVEKHVYDMLTHGALILPNVLSAASVARLRQYIVQRNAEISDEEQYPVSQGHNRISYGIDATEHPAVANAIAEITSNKILQSTLQQLLGDVDPASAEITAITGYYGCPDQAWHMDTKIDGNAVKFARTFSHSYSLFVSLQDITQEMGATDLCPGTHYCGNSVETMCETHHVRLFSSSSFSKEEQTTTSSTAETNRVWKAGDAALLNQHVWHRGSAHVDPEAPERILFIMSFLARPKLLVGSVGSSSSITSSDDTRQLSRGTYFHQKWNMWGHTYRDLLDPYGTMQKPWSILRCLGLWKPHSSSTSSFKQQKYNWGYDLVTAVFLRFSNEQLEAEDLSERWMGRLDQLGFPTWLRGRVLTDEQQYNDDEEEYYQAEVTQMEAWTTFFRETLDKMLAFVRRVYGMALTAYLILVAVAAAIVASINKKKKMQASSPGAVAGSGSGGARAVLFRATRRLIASHILVAGLAWYSWHRVETSPWAVNIRTGKTLMRPFPPPPSPTLSSSTSSGAAAGGGLPKEEGNELDALLSTWPQRNDVLLGTRYSAKFLGSYDRWLDFHPGNVAFGQLITQQVAPYYYNYYPSSSSSPSSLSSFTTPSPWQVCLLEYVRREIGRHNGGGGRLLLQDHRTGDWKIFAIKEEEWEAIHEQIVAASHPALAAVHRELEHTVARGRFGAMRGTALSRLGLRRLDLLRKQLFKTAEFGKNHHRRQQQQQLLYQTKDKKKAVSSFATTSSSWMLSATALTAKKWDPVLPRRTATTPAEREMQFRPGTSINVLFKRDGLYYPGAIMSIDYDTGTASVSYTSGEDQDNVALDRIVVRQPVVQGSHVVGCYSGIHVPDDCYPGTILRVHASGAALIAFEDGDTEWRQPWDYYVPPFRSYINQEVLY